MSSSDPSVSSGSSPQTDVPRPVSSFIPQTLPASEITDSITQTTTTPSERRSTSKVHQILFKEEVEQEYVSQVEYSKDGNLLAVSHDQYVDILKMNTDTNTDTNNNIEEDIFQPICRYELETTVTSLSFSPDSKYLAVVSEYRDTLFIFYDFNHNTTTQHGDSRCQRIPTRNEYPEEVTCELPQVTFSHDSKYIAVTTNNNKAVTIYIRKKESMRANKSEPSFDVLRDIHLRDYIYTMQFSPASESLAISYNGKKISIYDCTTGKLLHEIQHDSRVTSIKYSNNGQFLAAGNIDGLSVYNATTYKHIQGFDSKKTRQILDLAFSNSDNFIAMTGSDNQILIYDFSLDAIIYKIPVPRFSRSLAYSANNEYLTIVCCESVLTFDTSIYKNGFFQLRDSNFHTYSPNETYLVSYDNDQRDLKVFKTPINNNKSSTIGLEDSSCYSRNLSSDGRNLRSSDVACASFSMDEKYLAFADGFWGIFIHDLDDNKEVNRINFRHLNEMMRVTRIQYSSNGKYLAVTTTNRDTLGRTKEGRDVVLLYDATNNYELLDSQHMDDNPILYVAFSFDEKLVAIVTEQRASTYELESEGGLFRTPLKEIEDINTEVAVFSNGFKFLAILEGDSKKLRIIYNFMEKSTLSIDRDDDSSIPYNEWYLPELTFSPDSKVLAIGSKDGLVVDFLQLVVNAEDETKLEWKPYASPIYLPTVIDKISFAPMNDEVDEDNSIEDDEDNSIQQIECHTIFITHRSQGNDGKNCITKMKLHQHTVTPPEILLESEDTRICKLLDENKYSPLTRNQKEKTMISLAAENDNKLSLVQKLIQDNPSLAFAPNSNLKADSNKTTGNDSNGINNPSLAIAPNSNLIVDNNETNGNNGNGIMTRFLKRYHLNSLSKVADGHFFDSSTSLIEVDQMYKVIMTLIQEQVNSSVIVKLLNAGEEDCMDGFVIYSSIYATIEEPTKWWSWPSWLLKSLRREIQSQPQAMQREIEEVKEEEEQQQARPLAELQKTRSSKTEWVHSAWQHMKIDDRKRIELKVLRVLLPNLASFESLTNFTNMSDNKPFGCQSLHAAIDANWSNWARKWFLGQLILYVVWLIALTAFCMKTKQLNVGVSTSIGGGEYGWLDYCLAGIVVFGVLCFFYVEIRQIKVLSKEHYLNDWWNIWQWIAMIFAIAIVALRLIPGTSESLNGCISAISLFCSWIGLLYHLRGFESCAWIGIALYRIGKSLCAFILVVFVVIFSFSLALQALHDDSHGSSTDTTSAPSASPVEEPGSNFLLSLKTTFFASIMGEIDDDDFFKETYFDGLAYGILIILLVVVYLISLNALIAFISERFERVLDEKNAVLKKQKAKVILDLYCLFGEKKRRQIEEENKWTSLVIPAADLGMEDEPSTLEKNVSRATKEDMKEMKKEIKEVNVETKKEIKEDMKKEMTDMKKEIKEDMKNEMTDMKNDMKKEMKVMMEIQDAKMKVMMEQIIATINASKQGSN